MIRKIKSNPNEPLILITNDDSIYSKGIRSLIDAIKDLGQVVVVAPSLPQSGMGHAVTLKEPVRLEEISRFEGVLKTSPKNASLGLMWPITLKPGVKTVLGQVGINPLLTNQIQPIPPNPG